jgi:hypothetical protein
MGGDTDSEPADGTLQRRLPFPLSTRPWATLQESERGFFSFEDDDLPLHPDDAAQIALLDPIDAAKVYSWASATVPPGWPDAGRPFDDETRLNVQDCWNDEGRRDAVRRWLANRGVPSGSTVYLLYDPTRIVETTWQMVVRYWDAFAWSVGFAMVVVDPTLRWACCFHHEEVITFGRNPSSAPPARPGGQCPT